MFLLIVIFTLSITLYASSDIKLDTISSQRFFQIADHYPNLTFAIVGDFCLDKYLEIDSEKKEISHETNLPVHNIVRVRSQAGGAGNILNNVVALGIGKVFAVGFVGLDGEGFELLQILRKIECVDLTYFITTPLCRTITYIKPLILHDAKAPIELNRLDIKNWSLTPLFLENFFKMALYKLQESIGGMILMEQVHEPDIGVITTKLLGQVQEISLRKPNLLILADSKCGLSRYPPLIFKMNDYELTMISRSGYEQLDDINKIYTIGRIACKLARQNERSVIITMAAYGMLAANSNGEIIYVPAYPLKGDIDVVGAGDTVMANIALSLAAGATLKESLEIASAAASIVIHQIGTTGTATVKQIGELLAMELSKKTIVYREDI